MKRYWKVPTIGAQFEMLTVTGKAYRQEDASGIMRTRIPAKCECGKATSVLQQRWGKQVSCGCTEQPRKVRGPRLRTVLSSAPLPSAPVDPDAERYEYRGRSNTLDEWARITGIDAPVLKRRVETGMSFEDAILKPVE